MKERDVRYNAAMAGTHCLQMQLALRKLQHVVAHMENPCGLRSELQRLAITLDNLSDAVQDPSFWTFTAEELEDES